VFSAGIHFSEISPQLFDEFDPALIGKGRRLDGPNTDLFVLEHAASQKRFDDSFSLGERSLALWIIGS